jgi:hypothetical protein
MPQLLTPPRVFQKIFNNSNVRPNLLPPRTQPQLLRNHKLLRVGRSLEIFSRLRLRQHRQDVEQVEPLVVVILSLALLVRLERLVLVLLEVVWET